MIPNKVTPPSIDTSTATECSELWAHHDRVEEVVDRADDGPSPDGEHGCLDPVTAEADEEGDGSPDEDGAEGGNHGHHCCQDSPEKGIGNAKQPVGKTPENSLNSGDGHAAERGRHDSSAQPFQQHFGVAVVQREKRTDESTGESAVAIKEEEDEEHDHDLRDGPDGVSDDAGELGTKEAGDGLRGLLLVDVAGEGEDASGQSRVSREVVRDLLLRGVGAEAGNDSGDLLSDALGEKEGRDDKAEQNQDNRDERAEIRPPDLCCEPSIGALSDDGDHDCADDGGEELAS